MSYLFSGCKILSAVPTSASSIQVKWEQYPLATGYIVDIRKKNSTDTAPIIIAVSSQVTDRIVQGLKPGTEYNVTLKVMNFFTVQCVTSTAGTTGKKLQTLKKGGLLHSLPVSFVFLFSSWFQFLTRRRFSRVGHRRALPSR